MAKKSTDTAVHLALIIAAGAVLRVGHLWFWRHTPYWDGFFLDELYHHLWAQKIAGGQIFPQAVFFRAPLYPYLVGIIYALLGADPLWVRIFQNLVGLGSAVLMYFAGKKLFGSEKLAFWSAFLWAINPIQIFFESRLLLDSLVSAGVAVMIFIIGLLRTKRQDSLIFSLGLTLGILAITRPTVLVFVLPIALWLWRYFRLRTTIFFLALALPIIPVALVNYSNGDTVLIASQGGINFYIGNNPHSDGTSAVVPEFGYNWRYVDCVKEAEDSLGKPPLPSEVSRFFWRKGLEFWENHPAEALALLGKKLVLLFSGTEIGNNGNIYFLLKNSPLFPLVWVNLGWGLLIPLALVGMWRGKLENRALLAGMFWIYALTVAAFFVCSRFRLPMVPLAVLFAVAGGDYVISEVRRRKYGALAAVLVLAVALNVDYFHWRRTDDPLSHFALGNIYLRRGEVELARREYATALKENPEMRGVNLNLGALYFREEKIDSAAIYFRREIAVIGERCRALSNLGVLARLRGDTASALWFGKQAAQLCPAEPSVVFNYAFSLYLAGKFSEADSVLAEFAEIYPDDPRILNLWGVVNLALGDTAAAEEMFRQVISAPGKSFVQYYDLGTIYSEQSDLGADPKRIRARAYYNLGQILVARGEVDRAREMFLSASRLDPDLPENHFALGAIYLAQNRLDSAEVHLHRAAELGFSSPELMFNLAAVKIRRGQADSAKIYLRRALEIFPDFQLARKALQALETRK